MTQPPPEDSPKKPSDAVRGVEAAWRVELDDADAKKLVQQMVLAAGKGNRHRVSFILASYPTATTTPAALNEALYAAALSGQQEVCVILLKKGAVASSHNSRALKAAVISDNGHLVDLLLRHGADITATQKWAPHRPLLACALAERRRQAAKALLLHGVNPNGKDSDGRTLRALAQEMKLPGITDLIDSLWHQPPAIPDDFATRLPLEDLRRVFPLHDTYNGFQLATYHGQFDVLATRLVAEDGSLSKSDILGATLHHPQNLLFILGQRGELAKAFQPHLWGYDSKRMRAMLPYIPAAFRDQIDESRLTALFQQDRLRRHKKNPQLRLPPR